MKDLRDIGPYLQLGWVVAVSTLVPLGMGIWLDRRLGTAPLVILIGAVAGILTSTVAAVRFTSRVIETLGMPPETGSGPARTAMEQHATDEREDVE